MIYLIGLIVLGVIGGVLSGIIGIGGGVLIVPALVFIFGFSQLSAQGTTLSLLIPPIGIFAAMTYYKAGNVNIKAGIFIAIGFIIGGLIGAHFAHALPEKSLARIFGVALILIGAKSLL